MDEEGRMIIYDTEIKKAILKKGETPVDGIEYCEGWGDYSGMGIACVCAFDTETQRAHVFMEDNLAEFQSLVDSTDCAVSFNGILFDNKLLVAHGITVPAEKCYDILAEVRRVTGKMISLSDLSAANLGTAKSMNGGMAPVLWQQGKIGELITYCLADVAMTQGIMSKILLGLAIIHPHTGGVIDLSFDDSKFRREV
jgi:hypothetical protein